MSTPTNASDDAANAAAERIQQLWRQYRDAVQQFEHASIPRAGSLASLTGGSATAGGSAASDEQALADLEEYEAHLNVAAALVQRRWRQYRVEVVTASTEGLTIPQSSYGNAAAESGAANAERWHEWSRESDWSTARAADRGRAVPADAAPEDAASRIQRRWKRYRSAVRHVEASQNSMNSAFDIEAAAALIQRRWRQYVRVARDDTDGDNQLTFDHAFTSETDRSADAGLTRGASSGGQLADAEAVPSSHDPHDAARRIQRLWKRYREAVDQFEDTASTVESNAVDVATAAETIQRRWRHYLAVRRQHSAGTGRPHDDDVDLSSSTGSSSSESTASAEDDQVAEDNIQLSPPQPPPAAATTADTPAAAAPAPRPLPPVNGPRDAAALMIQFWWRRRDPNATDATLLGGAAAADDDTATRPQRIRAALQQAQAEWAALIDQVRFRDRTEAAIRVQEAWRRHRTVTQYRTQLAAGRRDSAARSIQLAFRRRHQAPQHSDPEPHSERNGAAVATARRGAPTTAIANQTLPTCIVCLDEIVQMALLPCGHAHLCAECAPALRRCPACRALISVRIRIYL